MLNVDRTLDFIILICALYSVYILKNFPVGCFFVFIMFVREIVGCKKEPNKINKIFVCLWGFVLISCLILTYLFIKQG